MMNPDKPNNSTCRWTNIIFLLNSKSPTIAYRKKVIRKTLYKVSKFSSWLFSFCKHQRCLHLELVQRVFWLLGSNSNPLRPQAQKSDYTLTLNLLFWFLWMASDHMVPFKWPIWSLNWAVPSDFRAEASQLTHRVNCKSLGIQGDFHRKKQSRELRFHWTAHYFLLHLPFLHQNPLSNRLF